MADANGLIRGDGSTDASEAQQRIAVGLEGLPCLTRAVFLLHRLDDLAYDDIAWRCGISVDEVILRMADGLTGLRRFCDGDPTLLARIRRAMLPWRFAWALRRRERRDRQLGL